MLGKTHMMVGIATTLAITRPQKISHMVMAVGAGAIGGLICDIDVETSKSHKEADRLVALSCIFIMAIMVSDLFFNTKIFSGIMSNGGIIRILIGMAIFIGVCAYGKEQPHRTFMHSLLALVLLDIGLLIAFRKIVVYFSIGFLSHIGIDILNKRKVKVLYPFGDGIALSLCTAKGLVNDLLLMGASVIVVIESILFFMRVL